MQPLQPGRWQEVLNKLQDEAKEHNVNPELITDIWNRIHAEALDLEK